jgi:hypothetical protein
MRNLRRRWKEAPQFQNEYGGFDRDLILIFGLNLSIGFTVLSRGTHSHEFLVVKMFHMRCYPWEKTPTKISHSTSSCTGSDDPALGRTIRTWWLVSVQSSPGRMIRPCTGWSGPGNFSVCLVHSVNTTDDPRLPRMIRATPENTQRSLSGVGVYIPLHPLPSFLSLSPTNLDSKALNPPLLSILELDSCKETPRDWVEVRFEVWFEGIPWASTCSFQEAFEATLIRRFAFVTLGALLLDR